MIAKLINQDIFFRNVPPSDSLHIRRPLWRRSKGPGQNHCRPPDTSSGETDIPPTWCNFTDKFKQNENFSFQTLERHKGLTATARKNRFETRDLQLKQDLRVALKSSLYRITVTFGDSLNTLDLPTEHRASLANYQSFREG